MASIRQRLIKSGKVRPAYVTSRLIADMTDRDELIVFLNVTAKLSDADFETVLHQNGVRVASWIQREQALKGNKRAVDALETYIKRGKEALSRSNRAPAQDDAIALPAYKPRGDPKG